LARILILLHERERPGHHHYLIGGLAEAWEQQGLEVLWAYGLRERPEADLLIPQVNLTHLPPRYLEYIRSYPAVVNREVVDIAKRAVSTHLLRGDEEYRGPVIVKTDCNFGGRPEFRLSHRWPPVVGRLWQGAVRLAELATRQPLAWQRVLLTYPVYASLAEVPAGVLRNPALVMERFVPEREGDQYVVRYLLCLGDRVRNVRVTGPTPFVKEPLCPVAEEVPQVPEAVLAYRRRLGLDYGKIDYTLHDGEAVILDVNRTVGRTGTPAARARTVSLLADGIWSLLPGSR